MRLKPLEKHDFLGGIAAVFSDDATARQSRHAAIRSAVAPIPVIGTAYRVRSWPLASHSGPGPSLEQGGSLVRVVQGLALSLTPTRHP